MKETISFVPWTFIKICCGTHKEELSLTTVRGIPVYCCQCDDCSLKVPAEIYEKILDSTVAKLNANCLAVGSKWRQRFAGKSYGCSVLSAADGKKPEIGVIHLG